MVLLRPLTEEVFVPELTPELSSEPLQVLLRLLPVTEDPVDPDLGMLPRLDTDPPGIGVLKVTDDLDSMSFE